MTVITTEVIAQRAEEEKNRLRSDTDFLEVRKEYVDAQERTAVAVKIDTDEQYETTAVLVRDTLKPRLKRMQEFFRRFREPVNAARQVILDAEHEHCDGLAALIGECTAAMTAYREKRDAEQREAEAEARKEAEQRELERIANEADALREAGDIEQAEELLAQPIATIAPAPVARRSAPTISGVSTVVRWRGRVIDYKRLVRWVSQDPDSRGHYVKVDQQAIDAAATSQRKALAIPGVVAEPITGTVIRQSRTSRKASV